MKTKPTPTSRNFSFGKLRAHSASDRDKAIKAAQERAKQFAAKPAMCNRPADA